MNNYNSLNYRKDSKFSSREPDVVGNAPNSVGGTRTSWLMSFMLFCTLLLAQFAVGQTLTVNATGTTGSFNTGSVTSAGVKSDGNMVNINSSGSRGFAKFDISSLPAGAVITGVTCNFTTFTSTSSTATNTIFGFVGDPASISGATLYTNCGTGTSFNTTSWTANALNSKAFNATGINFVQANATSTQLCIGFVRGSTNNYNISGYGAAAASQPQLVITYTIPTTPPNCATGLVPANLATGITRNPILTWTAPTGTAATSYDVYFGTTPSPSLTTNVSTTSYTPVAPLLANTTYYWKVVPRNGVGPATGCVEQSFTTGPSLTYCSAVPTSVDGNGITNVVLGTLSNPNVSATTYQDFTALTPTSLAQTTSNAITVTLGTGFTYNVRVFIDFNQNGSFNDAGENTLIGLSTNTNPTSISGNIVVPASALLGNTRMRIVGTDNDTSNDPCWSSSFANVEDYTVTIVGPPVLPPNCATALLPADAAINIARNTTLSWTAATGSPTSYDVYLGTSSPAAFLGNVTNTSYTLPSALLANTLYYYKVVAKNANGSATGCIEQTFTTGTSLLYCDPVYTTGKTSGDLIANIVINGTTLSNNSGSAATNPAYTYFTGQPNYTTTLQAGSSYTVTITIGSFGSQNVAAWIDYNDNGVFETSERIGTTGTSTAGIPTGNGSASFGISLACNPPLGTHRMRVRDVWLTAGTTIDPCASYGYGETEDYDVTISAADPCPKPTTLAAASITQTTASLSWVLGCAETNWEVKIQAAGAGVPTSSGVAVTSTTYAATGLTVGTNYEFYVRSACTPGSLYSTWSGPFAFSTLDNAPACATMVSPANGATNVTVTGGAVALSWTAPATSPTEGTATSYDVYEGTTSGALTLIGNVTTLGANVTGLGYNQTIYWRIVPKNSGGSAVGPCVEWSFTTPGLPANDVCTGATDLATLTSPYTDSTAGLTNDFTPTCNSTGTAPDRFYKITVPNGWTLNIGQTTNTYDSVHTAFYGTCAAYTEIVCTDDPDTLTDGAGSQVSWQNTTGASQTVYWVQDGYSTGSGSFTLAWSLVPPPVTIASFTPDNNCGQLGGIPVVITGTNLTGTTSVTFNGISASFVVNSDTQVTATLPAGNTSGNVVVYASPSSNGSATSTGVFTAKSYPTVNPITGGSALCMPNTLTLSSTSPGGTWTTSDSAIATVVGGVVTGVSVGQVTISYAVTVDGCTTTVTQTVDVSEPVAITSSPSDVTAITGSNVSFTVAATGTGLTYQWFESTDGGTVFDPITIAAPYSLSNGGATLNIANVPGGLIPAGYNGRQYQCVVTGTAACGSQTSGAALLSVGNTGIISGPTSNSPICETGSTSFSVQASGDVTGFDWYLDRNDANGPVLITNGMVADGITYTISTFDPTPATFANLNSTLSLSGIDFANNVNGFLYGAVVHGPASDPATSYATLNVSQGVSVTAQPSNTSVCRATGSAQFAVGTNGTVGSIQWQQSANATGPWTNVTGGTSATLTVSITGTTPVGVTYYKAIVNGVAPCLSTESLPATLTVTQPTIAVSPASASYCIPGSAVALTANGASTYTWSPATGLFTDAAGTVAYVANTPATTVYAAPASNTTYTVTGTDGSGCVNTTTVSITVGNAVSSSASANLTTVCPSTAVQLTANGVQSFTPSNIGAYVFSTTTSPYQTIVGGVGTTAMTTLSSMDDSISASQTLPFTFNYGGTNFTTYKINSNGWINLGAASTSTTNYSSLSGTDNNVIAAFNRDLNGNNTTATTYYVQTVGTAPNRITKIEWVNIKSFSSTINPETGNFQVWLYESSNAIEIRYGSFTSASARTTTGTVQVGLRGASTAAANVRSLSNTGSWSTPTVGTSSAATCALGTFAAPFLPDNGRVYRFVPGNTPTYTYAWTSTPAGFTSSAQNPTVNPTVSTTYSVVVTSTTGCNSTSSVAVAIAADAVITTQPAAPAPICQGGSTTLSVTATGPGLTYQWMLDGSNISGATSANYTITNAAVAQSGSYTVLVTPSCGNTATSNPVSLLVNPTPTATAPANQSYCFGSAISPIALTGTPSGVVFDITGGASVGLANQTGVTSIPSFTGIVGTATVTITPRANGCTGTAVTYTITVNALPNVPTLTATSPICQGSTLNLTASTQLLTGYAVNSNSGVAFIDISTTGTSVGTIADDSEHYITLPSAFTYNTVPYTTAAIGNNGVLVLGATTGDIYWTNATLPQAATAATSGLGNAGAAAICAYWDDLTPGTGGSITTQTVGNKYIVQWTNEDSFAATGTGTITFQIQLDLVTGQIHLVYPDVVFAGATANDNGGSATVGLNFSATAAQQYSFNTASLVNNQSITYTPNALSYAWTGPNGFTSNVQNPSIANATPAASGVYSVTVTNTATGCSVSASTSSVTVVPTSVGGTASSVLPAVCSGFGTSLSVTGYTGAIQWQQAASASGPWTDISGATSASLNTGNLTATTYYQASVTSGVCSAATSNVVTVTVNPLPTVTVSLGSAVICPNTTTTITAVPGTAGSYSYVWTVPSGVTNPGNVATFTSGVAGVYRVVITNTATGCVSAQASSSPITISTTCSTLVACGTTLTNIDDTILSSIVANAQGYRWRVTKMINGVPSTNPADVQYLDTLLRALKITQLTSYAFDTQYQVEVAVRLNNVWATYYGSACSVRTPATTTKISSTQCGSTVALMTDVVYADIVPFSTGYRFKATNLLNQTDVQIVDRPLREFRFSLLSNVQFSTPYKIEVAVRNTDGTYLPYGQPCTVTTPLFPTSQLQASQCDYTATSVTEVVYANIVSNATAYRFLITNSSLSYSYTFDSTLRSFQLNTVPGLVGSTTYTVQVAVQIGGTFGPYGKSCTLTTPAALNAKTIVDVTALPQGTKVFEAMALPNPFADNFKLDVKTSSEEVLQVKVYDMLGKLVDTREVSTTDVQTLEVGTNYPSGVYNVIVTQGENTKTLRVIKR